MILMDRIGVPELLLMHFAKASGRPGIIIILRQVKGVPRSVSVIEK